MNFLKLGVERLVALALICGLALLAVPAAAQDRPNLEEFLIEQTLQELDRSLESGEAGLTVKSKAVPSRKSALQSATGAATGSLRCLPTCDVTDGRFLAIASRNLVTLSESDLDLEISVPADATSFTIGVFDGDGRGVDGSGVPHWDTGAVGLYEYTLYADPTADGTGALPVELQPGVTTVVSNSLPDNAWKDFIINTATAAQAPSGNFFYRLNIRLTTPAAITLNAFKIRTTAALSGLTLDPVTRPFSYVANLAGLADASIIFPTYPATTSPTYDGTFRFYFEVPASRQSIEIWDGDFDRGSFDGLFLDTDDPDTPNTPFLPAWSTIDTVPEQVSTGVAGSTGSPPDDRNGAGSGIYLLRSPSVRYDLIFPDGRTFSNENPSGNQEWEQFRISTEAFNPATMDHSTSTIPPGIYELRIQGVDMQNLNALQLPFRLICVDDLGVPCILPRPYLVGDTVFYDRDGDGVQEPGEAGIGGVTVNLLDTSGTLLATTTTGSDGSFQFGVEQGAFVVEIDSDSFNAGGPLAGMISTTGGERQSDTVTTNNVLDYDFGYRGTASLGSLVWLDTNGDGTQNVGEVGIGGVTVDLLDAGGNLFATTVTDANGAYQFISLTAGAYSVQLNTATLPAGTTPTFDVDGTATANVATVTLSPGQNRTDVNFGYRQLGNILGRLWNDGDADGAADTGESGINGVTVQLLDGSGTVVAATTTSGDGNYSFPNLPAGIYTVRVDGATLPSGVVATGDYDGVASLNLASLVLPGGATIANVDFGYFLVKPGAATGTIGYWKNHASAWPVQQITIGSITYTKSQAIALISQPSRGDKTIDLAKQLIATKLNLLLGNNPTCISDTVSQADAWLVLYPVGSNVKSSNAAWTTGGPLHQRLDAYNNGNLCAPHRG